MLWRSQRIPLTPQSFCSCGEITPEGVKEVKTGPITVSVGKGFMQQRQPLGGQLLRNRRLGSSFGGVCGGAWWCLNLKRLLGSLLGEGGGRLA